MLLRYGTIKPMEPRSADQPFDSTDYIYQVKWDGVRIVAFVENGNVRLQNRKLRSRTQTYPDFSDLAVFLTGKQAILDGEMVVLVNGKPDFSGILKRDLQVDEIKIQRAAKSLPATFIVFDLLALEGSDLTKEPLNKRLELLQKVIKPHDYLQVIENFPSGVDLFTVIKEQELEGIVAKRRDSPYLIGKKTDYWLKIKPRKEQITVIGGYTTKGGYFSSLLMGAYQKDQFYYLGNVSTGLTFREMKLLQKHLQEIKVDKPPFVNPPKLYGVLTHWVEPLLTVKVEFMEWTGFFQMRAPVIKGFTKDDPRKCSFN